MARAQDADVDVHGESLAAPSAGSYDWRMPSIRLQLTSSLLREAARALGRSKLRSALTAIGITIGIAAVVCVVAIGRAGAVRSEEQLKALGTNLVWIEEGSRAPNGVRTGSHTNHTLTVDDMEAIAREVPQIRLISPNIDGKVQIAYGNRNWRTGWRGVTPEYFEIKGWTVAEGSPFSDEDVRRNNSVCLIGKTVRERLFGDGEAVGRTFRIGSQLCMVRGVLASKGQSANGQDLDDTILLPFSMGVSKIRGKGMAWLDDILCSAVSPQAVNEAIAEITTLLRQRHSIRPGQDDDFNIRRPEEAIKAQLETAHTFAMLLISIASISLIVGGIGIMNVMLVSVTERTREIGLRLAVGASGQAVQLQFLGEAVLLSLVGGVFGILLGVASSYALGQALDWPMAIPTQALLVAPAFAMAVGVVFGFYPARE
jgi:putative ABC transport system permease protein